MELAKGSKYFTMKNEKKVTRFLCTYQKVLLHKNGMETSKSRSPSNKRGILHEVVTTPVGVMACESTLGLIELRELERERESNYHMNTPNSEDLQEHCQCYRQSDDTMD
ncbi:hypothetical protein Tco_1459239 [Tanacetum coccineum]